MALNAAAVSAARDLYVVMRGHPTLSVTLLQQQEMLRMKSKLCDESLTPEATSS
jgi:hypothetical protein